MRFLTLAVSLSFSGCIAAVAPPEPSPMTPGQERHESCKPTDISQRCPIG